jgi:hypothetical protein
VGRQRSFAPAARSPDCSRRTSAAKDDGGQTQPQGKGVCSALPREFAQRLDRVRRPPRSTRPHVPNWTMRSDRHARKEHRSERSPMKRVCHTSGSGESPKDDGSIAITEQTAPDETLRGEIDSPRSVFDWFQARTEHSAVRTQAPFPSGMPTRNQVSPTRSPSSLNFAAQWRISATS